jgi:hypothetical protein
MALTPLQKASQKLESTSNKTWAENDWASKWSEETLSQQDPFQGNVLESLKQNLNHLNELHSRLEFLMGEIRGLIRK